MASVFRTIAAVLLAAAIVTGAAAQNVTEWSSEARTTLAFKVDVATLQPLLPPGWVPAPSTSAATPGATVNVTFMERQIVLDPQGKPIRAGTTRYAVLGVPARNTQSGQANTIIVTGLSPEGKGAYGVYTPATSATLQRTVDGSAEEFARVQERWELAGANGDHLSLALSYRRGPVTRERAETIVRSALRPDFQRTYRIDQATDMVRSANGADRVERLTFRASGPSFSRVLDGTETLVGVTAIPYYVREISIP
jgi:hypothetical protein